MIVSYETLRSLGDELKGCEVGLLLADEGHRLKNAGELELRSLPPSLKPRSILSPLDRHRLSNLPSSHCHQRQASSHPHRNSRSGSSRLLSPFLEVEPELISCSFLLFQNDLTEFFALLDFANPGYLGTRLDFRKNYELAICRGRDSDASELERAKSDSKLKELTGRTGKFMIRRTNDLLSKYRESLLRFPSAQNGGLSSFFDFAFSSRQVRSRRLLRPRPLPARTLPALHQVARDQETPQRNRVSTSQSHQHPQETLQPS